MTESNELRFIQSVRVSRYLYHEQTIEEGSRAFLTTFGCDVDHRFICKSKLLSSGNHVPSWSLPDLNVVLDDKSVTLRRDHDWVDDPTIEKRCETQIESILFYAGLEIMHMT